MFSYQIVMYLLALFAFPVIGFLSLSMKKDNSYCFSLSRDTTDSLRGISITAIVLHHMTQQMPSVGWMKVFSNVGYLGVSIFLFLSGYGLIKSYLRDGGVLNSFVKKRFVRVYIPYLIATLILFFSYREHYDFAMLSGFLIFSKLVNPAYWYVACIMFLYCLYYINLGLLKFSFKYSFFIMIVGSVLYWVACLYFGLGKWWYTTVFCFLIGMLVGYHNIDFLFKPRFLPVVLVIMLVLSVKAALVNDVFLSSLSKTFSSMVFVGLILSLLTFVSLASTIFQFLGKISYELYLIHVMPFLLNPSIFNVSYGPLIYVFEVVFLSYVFNQVQDKLLLRLK